MRALTELLKVGMREFQTKPIHGRNTDINALQRNFATAQNIDQNFSDTSVPFLSHHLTNLITEHINKNYVKAQSSLNSLRNFYSQEFLKSLDTVCPDQNFSQRVDKYYFTNVEDEVSQKKTLMLNNEFANEYDLNEISLQFFENCLQQRGCLTLVAGCFFYDNLQNLLKSRDGLINQAFQTSTLFLSTGLSKTPFSAFPTPDQENLIRFLVGLKSNKPNESLMQSDVNMRGPVRTEDKALSEFLSKIHNEQDAYEEVLTSLGDFSLNGLEKSIINPFYKKKVFRNLLVLYQENYDSLNRESFNHVYNKTKFLLQEINKVLSEINLEFKDDISDYVTGNRTPFYLYKDICKIGVSYLNAFSHVCSNLLNLANDPSIMMDISLKIEDTILHINNLSQYLYNMTNKFSSSEFIECDYFLFLNLSIYSRFSTNKNILDSEHLYQ